MVALALVGVASGGVEAAALVVEGDLRGAPVFARPDEGNPPTTIAYERLGENPLVLTHFQAVPFLVADAGAHTVLLERVIAQIYDPFLVLYAGDFDPARPLWNVLEARDDIPFVSSDSRIVRTLAAGRYVAVATSYTTEQTGRFFRLTVTGPGSIVPAPGVPEPGVWGMMVVGFGAVGLVRRRRRVVPA